MCNWKMGASKGLPGESRIAEVVYHRKWCAVVKTQSVGHWEINLII